MSAALHGNSQLVTISFVMNNGPKVLNLRVRLHSKDAPAADRAKIKRKAEAALKRK
jgi:hypothetical protein